MGVKNYTKVCKYWPDLFNPEFKLLEREVNIYSLATIFSRAIGRIDYIAQYKDTIYLIEEDMAHADKWHWVKILAYRAAYLLAHPELNKEQVKCLIFIRDNEYTPDFIHLADSLGIEYVTFTLLDCSIMTRNTSSLLLLRHPGVNSAYVGEKDRKLVNDTSKALTL
jgi:hypothetical protein